MSIIKGLSIAQVGLVILMICAWDGGLARLGILLLKKAQVTSRGVMVWITTTLVLTVLQVISFEYLVYITRTHQVTAGMSWLYMMFLPAGLFCQLTGFRLFEMQIESPATFWLGFITLMIVLNLVLLSPALQIGMKRKLVAQAV